MKDFYKISEISRLYGVGPEPRGYGGRGGRLCHRRKEDKGSGLYGMRDI